MHLPPSTARSVFSSLFYTSSNVYKYLRVCLGGGQGQGHVHDGANDDDDDVDDEEEVEDVAKLLTHFGLGNS